MFCSKEKLIRIADAVCLIVVFLVQSVILNYYIISYLRHSSLPFLWFLGDFLCLLVFSFAVYLAYRAHWKEAHKSGSLAGTNSRTSSRTGHRSDASTTGSVGSGCSCFSPVSKVPFSYVTWIIYSVIMIAKIVVLFKQGVPQQLRDDEFFGTQLIKVAIGLSAIIFSLLVEAHHDWGRSDSLRNEYVKSVAYGMAMEILDSVSFLSLLIVNESHIIHSFRFENFILCLTSLNLMLPAISLYKLSVSGYGQTYRLPLEILYKLLHLICVNIPYLSVRIYLWQLYSFSDTSIFMVKNIYSIFSLLRGIYPDLIKYYYEFQSSIKIRNMVAASPFHSSGHNKGKSGGSGGLGLDDDEEESSIGLTTFSTKKTMTNGTMNDKEKSQTTNLPSSTKHRLTTNTEDA